LKVKKIFQNGGIKRNQLGTLFMKTWAQFKKVNLMQEQKKKCPQHII